MKTYVNIFDKLGEYAGNKDIARDIRIKEIIPAIANKEEIVLDFKNVSTATQSFIHALISDVMRKHGYDSLDYITFKSCNDTIKAIINIVVKYMQEITEE